MDRRDFLKTGVAGAALLAIPEMALGKMAEAAPSESGMKKERTNVDKFHLGMAGYTFVNFDIDTTLRIMQRLDVHWLCIKDFHLPLDSTEDQISSFHAKLAEKGVAGYAVGPIYMKSEAEVDRAFDYARRVGVKLIVSVPNYELLPYVEKKVKEYEL